MGNFIDILLSLLPFIYILLFSAADAYVIVGESIKLRGNKKAILSFLNRFFGIFITFALINFLIVFTSSKMLNDTFFKLGISKLLSTILPLALLSFGYFVLNKTILKKESTIKSSKFDSIAKFQRYKILRSYGLYMIASYFLVIIVLLLALIYVSIIY